MRIAKSGQKGTSALPQVAEDGGTIMKIAALIFLAALACSLANVRAATHDWFAEGVEVHRNGQFAEAAEAFENAAAVRPAAGTFIDLGLAEWQRGHAGPAILAWERARWIDPFNRSASENLNFARQVTQLDAPELNWFETLSTWLPPAAWLWLAGASLWLAVGMILLPAVFRRQKAGWHQSLAACGLCVFLFSLAANWGVVGRTNLGIVLENNAPLLLTPTRDGEMTSTLTSGESAREIRTLGDFYLIRTESQTGWIKREQFGLVSRK
jgi:tetratricopeptide (TPR) repeat protein